MEIENVLIKYAIPEINQLILEYAYKCHRSKPSSRGVCDHCMAFSIKGEDELWLKVEYHIFSISKHKKYNDKWNDCDSKIIVAGSKEYIHCDCDSEITIRVSPKSLIYYDCNGYVKDSDLGYLDGYIKDEIFKNYDRNFKIYPYKSLRTKSAKIIKNNGAILKSDTHYEFEKKYRCCLAVERAKEDERASNRN